MRKRKWTYVLVYGLSMFAASGIAVPTAQENAAAGEARPVKSPARSYVDVSESAVMLQNEKVHGSNITCLATDEGLVFVDCGLFTEIAAAFRRDMEARFEKKTIALFLTHGHTDHFFGMGAFGDVPVVAAAAEKPLFEQQLSVDFESRVEGYKRIFPLFDQALKTARPFAPNRWFEDATTFGTGKNQIVIRRTGGHTAGSSCALMPAQGVLVAGDNVQVDYFPYFGDRTGDMPVWIKTLRQWEGMDLQKICPGHGRVVDKAYVTAVRGYYEDLVTTLEKLKSEGVPVREAVSHPDLPAGYWPEGMEKPVWFDPAVAGLYRSLEVD
jgi:glyoxylase-like metal-dependent hydrolase (beta-lactamase superfamily II)